MIENTIIYEQPLNEIIRVCLRLEQLFFQLDHQLSDPSITGTRNVVSIIINILQLLDRPDLKAKLAKELMGQINLLIKLQNTPEVDFTKLQTILKQLEELSRNFIESSVKIGQPLREIELLNNLRLHLTSPGGGCSFDIPVFYYWLNQPASTRQATIQAWLAEFNNVRLATTLLLQLTREGSKIQKKSAENGFYQELLDPQTNLRLIRVIIPNTATTYPEISIGRHFLSIRFYSPSIHERPTQHMHNLEFWLSYCTL